MIAENLLSNLDVLDLLGFNQEYGKNQILNLMKEYATLCCEAQRIACAENANVRVFNSLYEGYTGQDIIEGRCNNAQYIADGELEPYNCEYSHTQIENDDDRDYYITTKINKDSILNTPITLL